MESVYAESRRDCDQFIEGVGWVANYANMQPGVQGLIALITGWDSGMAAS